MATVASTTSAHSHPKPPQAVPQAVTQFYSLVYYNSSKIELRDRDARQFKRQYIYNNHRSYSRHCSLEILRGHPVENDIMYAYDDDRYTLTIVVFDDVGATKPSPHTAVAPIPHAGRPAVFRTSLLGC